jgi:peptidoglycan/LPS O-acetylase OafA/YrhL
MAVLERAGLTLPPRDVQVSRIASLRRRLWPESGAISSIPALDGLRAVAALLVLLFHSWSEVPNSVGAGQVASAYPLWYTKNGVDLFFVLSGFLLFLPYAEWVLGARSRPSAAAFYKRRILRVGPAYWASLFITVVIHPAVIQDILLHIVYLSNTTWPTTFSINGVYWTMAVEVQFYAVLPVIAWIMYNLSWRMSVIAAIALTISGLVVLSVLSSTLVTIGSWNLTTAPVVSSFLVQYAAMPYWLGSFGCGIACSLIYTYVTKVRSLGPDQRARLRQLGNYAFFAGIGFALALSCIPMLQTMPMSQLMFAIAFAALLSGVLFGAPLLRWPFETRVLRFIGLISYSFYIWHHAVLSVLIPRFPASLLPYHTLLLFAITLILTMPVAYVSYLLCERPFIAARKHAHERVSLEPAPALT